MHPDISTTVSNVVVFSAFNSVLKEAALVRIIVNQEKNAED